MRSTPEEFYKTSEWRNTRRIFLERHPFCEECLKRGEYTPARYVHHRIWLNFQNFRNPEVSLNPSNLEAVCLECHNRIHYGSEKRYKVNKDGSVSGQDIPPSSPWCVNLK